MQIGSEMAALQEKTPKMDPKKRFFWKIPQDFELLKKVPQNSHQTGQFGWNRYIGIWNLSHGAFLTDVSGQGMQFDICWDRSIWGNRARNPLSLFSRNCNEGSSLLARWGNIYPSPESRQTYLHTNPYTVIEICQTDESTFNLLFKAKRKDKKLGREPLQILEAKF